MDNLIIDLNKNGVDAVLKNNIIKIVQEEGDLRKIYEICWWPVDPDVPMLMINVYENDQIVTKIDKVYELLVPESLKGDLENSTMGSLTQGEHPVYGYPIFYLHPCTTGEFLDTLKNDLKSSNVLYTWLQTYGRYISLDIPFRDTDE